jgi:hypothetical protein
VPNGSRRVDEIRPGIQALDELIFIEVIAADAASNGLAVREGFEPSVELLRPYNGLANRRLQPLGHLTLGPQVY